MASDSKREKIGDRSSSDRTETEFAHMDHPGRPSEATAVDQEEKRRLEASQKLDNPLAGFSPEQLGRMGEDYCQKYGINDDEDVRAFRLGAMIAGNMNKYDTMAELTAQERAALDGETTHKWRNPKMLYFVVAGKPGGFHLELWEPSHPSRHDTSLSAIYFFPPSGLSSAHQDIFSLTFFVSLSVSVSS